MVVFSSLVLVQPAEELASVKAMGQDSFLMVVVPPPMLALPAAGLLAVGAVERV